jgi:hypothetical protein
VSSCPSVCSRPALASGLRSWPLHPLGRGCPERPQYNPRHDARRSPRPRRSRAAFSRLVPRRSHRGERCQQRLARQWPNLIVVHTPIHASWLNQVEIYFSIVHRKVLSPNDLNPLSGLEDRLLAFQDHYHSAAKPFQWRFTRRTSRPSSRDSPLAPRPPDPENTSLNFGAEVLSMEAPASGHSLHAPPSRHQRLKSRIASPLWRTAPNRATARGRLSASRTRCSQK